MDLKLQNSYFPFKNGNVCTGMKPAWKWYKNIVSSLPTCTIITSQLGRLWMLKILCFFPPSALREFRRNDSNNLSGFTEHPHLENCFGKELISRDTIKG